MPTSSPCPRAYQNVFRYVAVGVVVDREPVQLLLKLPNALGQVTGRDEPILVLFIQHLLETAVEEFLLLKLLLHLARNQIHKGGSHRKRCTSNCLSSCQSYCANPKVLFLYTIPSFHHGSQGSNTGGHPELLSFSNMVASTAFLPGSPMSAAIEKCHKEVCSLEKPDANKEGSSWLAPALPDTQPHLGFPLSVTNRQWQASPLL